jgi:hypothetical protein
MTCYSRSSFGARESFCMRGGFRPMTVEGQRYRWRFDGRLVVVPRGRSGPPLRVDWDWRDWLEPEGAGPEPRVVTPRFVAEAIGFALTHGWKPEEAGPPFLLCFREGAFRLVSRVTRPELPEGGGSKPA